MIKQNEVKELVHSLDHGIGSILCNKETLESLAVEMGYIRVDVDNTDQSDMAALAMCMRDITHKITMIDDLLHFVLDDFNENFGVVEHIKSSLFDKIVRNNKEEK